MVSVEWVEPSLIWNGRKLGQIRRPRIAEFTSDNFMPEFLDAMGGVNPIIDPVDYIDQRLLPETSAPLKLFKPLHGRYYMVVASLICRQVGLPDQGVDLSSGETVSFVIRREVRDPQTNQFMEQGWINDGPFRGWHTLPQSKTILIGEEQIPMHHIDVCTESEPGLNNDFRPATICHMERTLYYGYLPVGNREKYIEPTPFASPQAYIDSIQAPPSPGFAQEDFRFMVYSERVSMVWSDFLNRGHLITENELRHELALYFVLDFAAFLRDSMPSVWEAVKANNINEIPSGSAGDDRRALYTLLGDIRIKKNGVNILLRDAMRELQDKLPMVEGEDPPGGVPTAQYDLTGAEEDTDDDNIWTPIPAFPAPPTFVDTVVSVLVQAALNEETAPYQMSEEMESLLTTMVVAVPDDTQAETGDPVDDQYFIRLVYDYDPDCPPEVSERSQDIIYARFFDPDAPARMIRLEMPDISMKSMRNFRRGVGIAMPPKMREIMGGVNEDILDGEGLSSGPGWELGMICSFSIQIIFMVAIIVMFIFLILLNFVFWWLPLLKICFPIPKKSG